MEIQDGLSSGIRYKNPVAILEKAISDIVSQYDFILIDCPPNLGLITLNGIYVSEYYIIPTIPNHLSTWGLSQIISTINRFEREADTRINPLGIIISMYRKQTNLHKSIVQQLRDEASSDMDRYPRVFETMIPYTVRSEEATDYDGTPSTLKQKYQTNLYNIYKDLTAELLTYV